MNLVKTVLGLALAAVILPPCVVAQDAKKTDEKQKVEAREEKAIPVKVQIVFSEFDGEKKIRSLPYTALITVDHGPEWAKLRTGARVPVYVGKEGGLQYMDVGTNIDCRAHRMADGNFDLQLVFERSWVEGSVTVPYDKASQGAATQAPSAEFSEPVIRQFKSDLNLVMRDAQTVESTVATDPLSGKVSKIDVTLNVVK